MKDNIATNSKSVRVPAKLVNILAEMGTQIGLAERHAVTQIITMCVEDCLVACEHQKPIMPRIARISHAAQKDVVVADAQNFLFMGGPPNSRLNEDVTKYGDESKKGSNK